MREAIRLEDEGTLRESIDATERTLAIARDVCTSDTPDAVDSPEAICKLLDSLAVFHEQDGNFAAARKAWQESLEIRTKLFGPANWRSVDVRVALGQAERLETLSPEERLEVAKASDLKGQVNDLYENGRYREAITLAQQCVAIRKRLLGENDPDYSTSLHNLALLYEVQGDYARAEPLCRQDLEISERILGQSHPCYAQSLGRLADLYALQCDYARAEPLYRQVLEIRKRVLGESDPDYAASLNDLAALYCSRRNYAQAERLYRQALEIRERGRGESHRQYGRSLNGLANLYYAQQDCARAEPLYRQALEIAERTVGENHPNYARSLVNLAGLYAFQRDYARAEPLCRQAVEIFRRSLGENHPDYAHTLTILADIFAFQGDCARAEPLDRDAAVITRRLVESTSVIQSERQQLAMLASLRSYLDRYISVALYKQDVGEVAYGEMLAWKGMVFRRQRLARAAGESLELTPLFQRLQKITVRWASMARATAAPKQQANWQEEFRRLSEEKERLEAELSARSVSYRQAMKSIRPQEIQDALPAEAALVDFLVCSVHIPDDQTDELKRRWEKHLVAAVVRKGQGLELVDLGETRPMEEAVNTWRVTFGMSPRGAAAGQSLRKQLWEPLEPRLKDANLVLVSPDQFLGRMPLGALPGKEPGTYLLEERTIAMVPVPAMIPQLVGEPGRRQLKKNFLLLGDVDYDANPGKRSTGRPASPLPPVPDGHRAGEGFRFGRLPGTRQEIDAIQRMYRQYGAGQGDPTPLDGANATKQAFWNEASEHRDIHLATHGFFAPLETKTALAERNADRMQWSDDETKLQGYSPGLLSGLALAGANRNAAPDDSGLPAYEESDNGILTAVEIASMNLDGVNLVVLSACETGLGQAAGGEGLLGLQRAFQTAGAQRVVASLWRVSDNATQQLMQRFYENRWQRHMCPLKSLREAQLWMLRGAADSPTDEKSRAYIQIDVPKTARMGDGRVSPEYWAAFVPSGDWR